jgi:hypothetical protein
MLAFFPWFAIGEESTFGPFELVPYVRGVLPAGGDSPEQLVFDRVLEPYRESLTRSVERCTLLRWRKSELTDDIPDEEIADVFDCAELVAFAGLAARSFFSAIGSYSNRDAFRLTIQAFREPGGGVLVADTRRDGDHGVYFAAESVLVARPMHVVDGRKPSLDTALLNALLARQAGADWADYREAIIWFNSANTDSPDTMKEMEHIFLVSAFERLLDLKGGRVDDLTHAFIDLIKPSESILLGNCARIARAPVLARFAAATPLREVWIRDFYQLRGKFAHGRIAHGYPTIWTVDEHLLFASVAFPLMVRAKLTSGGTYHMSENDFVLVDSFEKLLCAEHFAGPSIEGTTEPHPTPWNKILSETTWSRANARWIASAAGGAIPK